MPTLRLLSVPPALMSRVRRYARAVGLEVSAAGVQLLRVALAHQDARARGARVLNATRTPAERSEAARRAVRARWARRSSPPTITPTD